MCLLIGTVSEVSDVAQGRLVATLSAYAKVVSFLFKLSRVKSVGSMLNGIKDV